jgi:ribosomal protein L11 methyltransferase
MTDIVAWQLTREMPQEKIASYEDMLDSLAPSIDISKNQETQAWVLNAFFDAETPKEEIISCVSVADKMLGTKEVELKPVYQEDWKEKAKHSFPPLEIGRFFVHSFEEEIPEGMVGLRIPAGLAFGTGEHPTTAGCLTLYESATEKYTFKNCLDMGAGSGVLAIAAAKVQNTAGLAVDIEQESVETCQENVTSNGVEKYINCVCGDGFQTPSVGQNVPYDLIFANILMQPLLDMAESLVTTLEEGGTAILSGFLTEQEEAINRKYTSLGLIQTGRFEMNNWVALSFIKQ